MGGSIIPAIAPRPKAAAAIAPADPPGLISAMIASEPTRPPRGGSLRAKQAT